MEQNPERLLFPLVGAAQAGKILSLGGPMELGTEEPLEHNLGTEEPLEQPSVRCTLLNWFDGIFWTANHEVIKNLCSMLSVTAH